MPYANDPANDPADEVRFLIGDTNQAAPLLTDEEVAFLLLDENSDPRRAAARAAETLAAKYTQQASERRVGPLMITSGNRTLTKGQEFARLATRLWARANSSSGPYAGGISFADKITRAGDPDRVRPAFRRAMMRYRRQDGINNDSGEELLSPPAETP